MVKILARKYLSHVQQRYLRERFSQKLKKQPDPARAKRFLCLQMNAIGDAIMSQPAWAALKSAIPDATIDIICRPHIAPLFRQDPFLDNIYPLETRKYRSWLFKDTARLYDVLYQGRYDVLIDFTALPLTAAVCAAWYAPASLGFSRRIPHLRGETELAQAYELTIPYSEEAPLRNLMLRLVTPFSDPGTDSKGPRLFLTEETMKKAASALTGIGIDTQGYIVLHPGAKWPPKRWPTRHWRSLIQSLQEEFPHPLIILGGTGDESLIRGITADIVDRRLKVLVPHEVDVAAAIIRKATLCVCNDSAPMHLAAAVGTPSIALFGPVSPSRSAPSPEEGCSALYEGMFCSPCTLYYSRNRCRRGINFCMFGIEPGQVLERAKKLLQPREPRSDR